MPSIAAADMVVFLGYFVVVTGVALWAARKPKSHDRSAEDFFLAGRALPWWVVGASLIAANISTEQIIAMNGTAFESGIAVVSYSWIGAALSILIVAKFLLPTFLRMGIYSMPEFLRRRYDARVSMAMGVFWLMVYVFVNLTSVLSLGAITLQSVWGLSIGKGVILLAALSGLYTIYGGLSSVAWTDFIQVAVLVAGGLLITWLGLDAVGGGEGATRGFFALIEKEPEKFHTVLASDHQELPWTGVFFGGLWIAAIAYWGCNQYIIQRALASKNLAEAQKGLLFASFLSLVVSVLIVLPGVIAHALYENQIAERDQAFPMLVRNLAPSGAAGLILAALVAAIVSSLNSMTNSAATIFTMDIYRTVIRPSASQRELVSIGRIASAVAIVLAVSLAPTVASFGRLFAFIQEYSGFIFPGVVVIFLLGLYWRKTTSNAALTVVLSTIPVSALFKIACPSLAFLNRMTLTFVVLAFMAIAISHFSNESEATSDTTFSANDARRAPLTFTLGATVVLGILAALYLYFW
ncbi:MAG: sodium/solute symporter [Pirellulales bacterium]|nr:sodium/solute symporter [Pirellulales bacterium]